jgi:hypothetical protein
MHKRITLLKYIESSHDLMNLLEIHMAHYQIRIVPSQSRFYVH